MLEYLHNRFGTALESKVATFLLGLATYLNPIALISQFVVAITANDLSGFPLSSVALFATIQIAIALEGIKAKRASMFWSMTISLIMSLVIICIVLIRR